MQKNVMLFVSARKMPIGSQVVRKQGTFATREERYTGVFWDTDAHTHTKSPARLKKFRATKKKIRATKNIRAKDDVIKK